MIRRIMFWSLGCCVFVAIWQGSEGNASTLADRTWSVLQSGGNLVRSIYHDFTHPNTTAPAPERPHHVKRPAPQSTVKAESRS